MPVIREYGERIMRLKSINVFSAYLGDQDKTKEMTKSLRLDADFLDYEFSKYTKFIDNDYLIQLNIECDPNAESIYISEDIVRGYPTFTVPFDYSRYQQLKNSKKRAFWIYTVRDVFDYALPLMNCSYDKIDSFIKQLEFARLRSKEINYTFWGKPIDTNWYEWHLAVIKLFEKYGLKITHYGFSSASYDPDRIVTAMRKQKEIIRIIQSGEVPKSIECFSLPKEFNSVCDSPLTCVRTNEFISVFYHEDDISIDENDIMEMKKFIKCEYGEVFSSYRYLTVMYSYSREHGKFSDFELIKTIEN